MSTTYPDRVRGQQLGLRFPPNLDPLREQGAAFLTEAFRASGAIGADNRVTAITRFDEFFGGGAGRKAWLSVEYAKPEPGLHRELFVKYPRDFGDPLRDLFAHLMEPETRFALLSRQPDFPVAVPKCYFADYDPETRSGILITERIHFGVDGVEPFHDKCLDYGIADPREHYQALLRGLARLAAAHKAGRFGAEIERQFPYDRTQLRAHDLIPYDAGQLQQKLAKLSEFAQRYPQLLPAELRAPAFLARFGAEAQAFLQHEVAIKTWLNADARNIALCHWNANIDNAWFWRDAGGELQAGLLDWGSVSQMNVAQSIYGALCAVETGFWNAHVDALVAGFAEEYARSGGPRLAVDELKFQFDLFVALLGMAWMLDAPTIIEAQLPDLAKVRDRYDPAFRDDFLSRAQLQLLTVLLNAWQHGRYGAVLERFLARQR